MNKKIVIFVVIVVALAAVGLSAFAVVKFSTRNEIEQNIRENSVMNSDHEMLKNAIVMISDGNQKTVYEKDGINVYEGELIFEKLSLKQTAVAKGEDYIENDEIAVDSILKKKLMQIDARKKGIELSDAQLQQSLDNIRINKGVDSDGNVTKDDQLSKFMKENGITYDEYETVLRETLQYDLIVKDYLNALYKEKLENRP